MLSILNINQCSNPKLNDQTQLCLEQMSAAIVAFLFLISTLKYFYNFQFLIYLELSTNSLLF